MPRTEVTVVDTAPTGAELALVAANTAGNQFVNMGREVFVIANADVAAKTVTFLTPQTVGSGLAVEERVVSIPAAETWIIGPFPSAQYTQADGKVYVDFEDYQDATIGVFRLTPVV